MRRLPSSLPRLRSTMFALSFVLQIIDIVRSTNTDPGSVPDVGHARLIEGEGRAAGLECWLGAEFLEDKHHLTAAFLIAIFFFISAFIVTTRWGCWKAADPGLKPQKQLTSKHPDLQSNLTTVDGLSNWTVSIPYAYKVDPIPTSSNELLNHFPSNLKVGVYAGFTTGVGPRR